MLRNAIARRFSGGMGKIARDLVRRAEAARDERLFRDAAVLYAEAARLEPGRAGVHVQCGHMFKESGDHANAEIHYLRAAELTPNDADLALQMGHFYRTAGRLAQAGASYERAAELKSGWQLPLNELAQLREAGWPVDSAAVPAVQGPREEDARLSLARGSGELVPELARRNHHLLLRENPERIEIRRLGRGERTHWGLLRTLRGIEAIRGFVISATPIVEVQILLNRQLVYRGAPRGGYPLPYEARSHDRRKYVFNVWMDFSGFMRGRYDCEIRAIDVNGVSLSQQEVVTIAEPFSEQDQGDSDGFIPPVSDPARSLEEQINARPSMTRAGRRALLRKEPEAILVQRPDQLGDLVVSIPAVRRLRQLFPAARIVGLLSTANHELGATLGIFDEIITIDFPEDSWERRRTMSLEDQAALRAKLHSHGFDMAIDFSENVWSRPLLLLSGAPFKVGFRSGDVPLDVEIEGFTHDPLDNHEIVPHTNKLLGLVEWLAAMVRSETNVARRDDLSDDRLAAFGLLAGDRFALLHDGARLKFSRWPHYLALAEMLIQHDDLHVVLLTDDPDLRGRLPEELARSDRFHLVDQRLLFDDFDALVSKCAVFVGNDSGPKHLASLRGAPVVSIHMARNNWNEWGQENGGFIISRRVPCTGCLIHHDPEECGKDFACMTHISVDEVFRAVRKLL